jgi:hypothetical protein
VIYVEASRWLLLRREATTPYIVKKRRYGGGHPKLDDKVWDAFFSEAWYKTKYGEFVTMLPIQMVTEEVFGDRIATGDEINPMIGLPLPVQRSASRPRKFFKSCHHPERRADYAIPDCKQRCKSEQLQTNLAGHPHRISGWRIFRIFLSKGVIALSPTLPMGWRWRWWRRAPKTVRAKLRATVRRSGRESMVPKADMVLILVLLLRQSLNYY